jgi:hypothetical protein
MQPEELKQNVTVYGPLFPEPVQIIIAVRRAPSGKRVTSSLSKPSGYTRVC